MRKKFTLRMTVTWEGEPRGWKGCTDEQFGRYIAHSMVEYTIADGIARCEDVKVEVEEIKGEEL